MSATAPATKQPETDDRDPRVEEITRHHDDCAARTPPLACDCDPAVSRRYRDPTSREGWTDWVTIHDGIGEG